MKVSAIEGESAHLKVSWPAGEGESAHPMPADTAAFLVLLGELAGGASPAAISDAEAAAASALFTFGDAEPLFVGRAPGRLDVMGGIADYSGARVLQMPTAEACLVAVQVQPESRSSSIPEKWCCRMTRSTYSEV